MFLIVLPRPQKKFDFNLTFTGPETLEPDSKVIERAQEIWNKNLN